MPMPKKIYTTAELQARIRANTIIDQNGCWIWQRSLKAGGYGQISINNHPAYAHVISYRAFIGGTAGLWVLHKCDVPACCNPGHLFLGTHIDNVRDMWAKGRAVPPPVFFGEANHKASLSDVQVKELRDLAATGLNQRQLARRFKVSNSTAWRLMKGLSRA